MELYIPAGIIVIAAWLATIGKADSFSDLLSVLLAMLFLYFSYVAVMPKVSDIKAMDVFLAGCFAFILVALLQTFVLTEKYFEKTEKVKNDHGTTTEELVSNRKVTPFPDTNQNDAWATTTKVLKKRKVHQTKKQKMCKYITCKNFFLRAVFPIAFVLFCLFYFVTYKHILKKHAHKHFC